MSKFNHIYGITLQKPMSVAGIDSGLSQEMKQGTIWYHSKGCGFYQITSTGRAIAFNLFMDDFGNAIESEKILRIHWEALDELRWEEDHG